MTIPAPPAPGDPITLCIETSNPSSAGDGPAVGLGAGTDAASARWIGGERLEPSGRHDDALMPAIERLCRAHGVAPGRLARVAVSIGPGGFTGVRIAVAAAKMIAVATGAACIGVPTAGALIRALDPAAHAGRRAAVCLAWKRNDVWRQVFEPTPDGAAWRTTGEGGIVTLDAAARDVSLVIADEEFDRMLRERGEDRSGVEILRPRFDAELVFRASLGLAPVDPAALLPIYPREPEAVTKWRELRRDKP